MKRTDKLRRQPLRRAEMGASQWLTSLALGLDALDFLERSRELAAETVVASPVGATRRPAQGPRR